MPRIGLLAIALTIALGAATLGHAATADQICMKSKLTASGKKTLGKLKCHAKAAGKGETVDTLCLSKAESKFQVAFTKAEAKGGCSTINDASTVEMLVDDCVNAVLSDLGTSA